MAKPEILSSQLACANKWTNIVRERVRHPSGTEGDYLIVERQPAIMIIPVELINGTPYTYLVKQFRHPIGKDVLQFPMGTMEGDLAIESQASKELEEETGLKSGKLVKLGEYFVDPGLSRQKCIVFMAEPASKGAQSLEDTEEGMEVIKIKIKELDQLIESGEIEDSWGFAGIYFLNKYLESQKE
jgi:8-oxo-dGTP pyrophosphatase MutT (NUDIX family)